MAHFLDLPREVRDMVIYHVLEQKRNPPEEPIYNDPGRHTLRDYHSISCNQGRDLFYEREWISKFAISSLLQVNRQLYKETKDALFRKHKTEPSYSLDVMLTDHAMMPTWLQVPRLSRKVNTVQAQIRYFLVPADKQKRLLNIWQGDYGSARTYEWLFYELLERFLHTGASGELPSKVDRTVVVNVIEINILSPQDQTLLAPREERSEWFLQHRNRDLVDIEVDLSRNIVRPEWLASLICASLRKLLRMDKYTAKFGAVLYERIGFIRFLVDGEIMYNVDLSDSLKELRHYSAFWNLPSEDKTREFEKWKANAILMRKERGLSVK